MSYDKRRVTYKVVGYNRLSEKEIDSQYNVRLYFVRIDEKFKKVERNKTFDLIVKVLFNAGTLRSTIDFELVSWMNKSKTLGISSVGVFYSPAKLREALRVVLTKDE